jgi:hypothetical protein
MAGEVAGFSRKNAEIILETVRYLRANGLIVPQSGRGRQFIPPLAPIYVRNDSGEEIPAYACLQTTGTVEDGGQNFITVDQPVDNTGDAGPYLFNGQEPIEIGGFGIAYDGPLTRMLTDGATLSSGDKCRPVVAEWYIELGGDLITIVGDDDIEPDTVRGVIGASGGGGAGVIEYKIVSTSTKSSGPYFGLKAASAIVHGAPCDRSELIGTTVEVIDHSNDLFDETSMVGYTGWAAEMVFLSLDAEAECDTMSPCHWAAINRVCAANTGTYAEPCPPEEE